MEKRIEKTPLERFIDELLHDVVTLDLALGDVANRIRVAAELLTMHNDRMVSFDGVLADMEKALIDDPAAMDKAMKPRLELVKD